MDTIKVNPVAGLSVEQLHLLRDCLEARRASLRTRQRNDQAVALDDEPMPTEPMDAAERTREQDDAILSAAREQALLAEIDHALNKLADGRYGVSELSGEPIGLPRLEAVPWARLTADEEEGA